MIIIATIGRYQTEEKTRKAILAGADILRFNFSRRSSEENTAFVKFAKETIDDLNAGAKTLIDCPINKIRLGDFRLKSFAVRENEEFICKSGSFTLDCNTFIPINTTKIGEKINLNQMITIGDGEIAIQVIDILDPDTIKIKILNNGVIEYMRTLNIPFAENSEQFIALYKDIFTKTAETEPNYFALSYMDRETNEEIKKLPELRGQLSKTLMIIKIDNKNSVADMEQLFQDSFYNMVILDRGEIGVNIPFEKLAIIQKKAILLSKKYNKPLIISSQILESTINNFIPSRAETTALAEMVWDGVKGIMFCKETGYETRPTYSISVAKKIIVEAEKYLQTYGIQQS